jgi:SAM-dependent methyltransferase
MNDRMTSTVSRTIGGMGRQTYDRIGESYTDTRRPDARIAARIIDALGDARTVVNVGAGAGSYEPSDRFVVAVEPSGTMIAQRGPGLAPSVQAVAEALPFRDRSFDAALASLTIHHWADWRHGLDEMQRVASRVVVFTFEPGDVRAFWLTEEYFPEIVDMDVTRCASVAEIAGRLGPCEDIRVPVPHDCTDGFLAAYWRRPEAYLDAVVRAGISGFALLSGDIVARGVQRLSDDLADGTWERRFGHVRELDELDVCYRLVVTKD